MSQVMTKSVKITCSHGASVVVTGSPKLVLGTEEVVTAAGLGGAAGDAWSGTELGGAAVCATCLPVTAGKATKLEVSGSPVLLAGFAVKTTGAPPEVVVVPSPPNKLEAI